MSVAECRRWVVPPLGCSSCPPCSSTSARPCVVPAFHSSQFKNNHFREMCSGSEAGSYLRLIDSCITQLKAQGPSRTCKESNEAMFEYISAALRRTCISF